MVHLDVYGFSDAMGTVAGAPADADGATGPRDEYVDAAECAAYGVTRADGGGGGGADATGTGMRGGGASLAESMDTGLPIMSVDEDGISARLTITQMLREDGAPPPRQQPDSAARVNVRRDTEASSRRRARTAGSTQCCTRTP
jgi:hypothetical protein